MSGLAYKASGHAKDVKLSNIAVEIGDYLDYDNATGHLITPVDSSGDTNGGIVMRDCDNSAGSAGAKKVRIDSGGGINVMQQRIAQPDTGGTVKLDSGSAGSVDTITADGVEILQGAVAFSGSLTVTAALCAAQINANNTRFYATSSGAVITIRERNVTKEAWTLVSTSTTIATTDVNASGGSAVLEGQTGSAYSVSGSRKQVGKAGNRAIGNFYRVHDDDGDVAVATNGHGVLNVDATGGTITSILAGATELLDGTVTWTTSNANTAALIAASINLGIGTHGYFAEVRDTQVWIWQTTNSLSESTVLLTTVGSAAPDVLEHVHGGSWPRVEVKLEGFGL